MNPEQKSPDHTIALVTVGIAGRDFGVPLSRVSHVFVPDELSPVPLAPPEIAGLLNLRGRIVTAVDLRRCLDLPLRVAGSPMVALGVEKDGELYGLIADDAREAISMSPSRFEPVPSNLDARWTRLCAGVCELDDSLLTVLDVDEILDLNNFGIAA